MKKIGNFCEENLRKNDDTPSFKKIQRRKAYSLFKTFIGIFTADQTLGTVVITRVNDSNQAIQRKTIFPETKFSLEELKP